MITKDFGNKNSFKSGCQKKINENSKPTKDFYPLQRTGLRYIANFKGAESQFKALQLVLIKLDYKQSVWYISISCIDVAWMSEFLYNSLEFTSPRILEAE